MQKIKYYKCPICINKKKFKTLSGWGDHMKALHPESIPEGYTIARYFYMCLTGKTHGICRTCKGDTDWNENSMKYNQYCNNPKCKEEYVRIAKSRMVQTYGKTHLLNEADMQRKMMTNRKISGEYRFPNGVTIPYVAKYEFNFLRMMDVFLHWSTSDIIGPSPHSYVYEYRNSDDVEHEGTKMYIPDFYIPTLNLEIEIKQTQTTHPKFIAIDQVKERLKDEMMKANPDVNYIKIIDNDFSNFFEYLLDLKNNFAVDDDVFVKPTMEGFIDVPDMDSSLVTDPYEEALESLKFFDKIRYKFSQIESIYKKMNKLRIGILVNNQFIPGRKNMIGYVTLAQKQISEYKCGLFFDYVHYQSKLLDKCDIKYTKYMIQMDNDMKKSHTFIIFYVADGFLYMENYRPNITGVYYPMSEGDIFNLILTDMFKEYGECEYKIYSYQIDDKNYPGRTLTEITKFISINGQRIYHIYSNSFDATKVPMRQPAVESLSSQDTVLEPEIKKSELGDYVGIKTFFRDMKVYAKKPIKNGTCIFRNAVRGPVNGKLRDMEISNIAGGIIPSKATGNVCFRKIINGNMETYDLIAIKDIPEGAQFVLNANTHFPEFYNEDRV